MSVEIEVAVPTPISSTFTYRTESPLPVGVRVTVPFAGRRLVGVVLSNLDNIEAKPARSFKLKSILEVIDSQPIYSQAALRLAQWLSAYYMHPIGETLRAMLPASVKTNRSDGYVLTSRGMELVASTENSNLAQLLRNLFGSKATITKKKLENLLTKVNQHPTANQTITAAALIDEGLVRRGKFIGKSARLAKALEQNQQNVGAFATKHAAKPLTQAQESVFRSLVDKGVAKVVQGQASIPFLLRGVTGAGKTEIYLQTIAELLGESPAGTQVLVMVPEISLTPQMTQIFVDRFGEERVAVVHSAMSDLQRWRELARIHTGTAQVLIGPRSAVFAPFKSLKLIIVDEEHDSSYKQHTGLMYHGRDVAVMRAHLESAMVLLGSATPSMESYANALKGKYHFLELAERIGGLPLPSVHLVEIAPKPRFGTKLTKNVVEGDLPIADEVVSALRENIVKREQSIVLVNRRGYAHYLFGLQQKHAVICPNCSISLTLHRRSTILRCHYCDYRVSVDKVVSESPHETYVAVGFGSEKIEQVLAGLLPSVRIARIDSDTVADKELLPKLLSNFRNGQLDILVGTQILAKGHDFPNVTLMVILEVDQLLDLPDFRAAERCFQLIVQAAGRAGRSTLAGRVYVQSARFKEPTIQLALKQDFLSFAERELEQRKLQRYPPFVRQVLIEFTSEEEARVDSFARRVDAWLVQYARMEPEMPKMLRVLGPSIPAIAQLRGRHRRSLVLSSASMSPLHKLTTDFSRAFSKPPDDIRIKIDVDPQSLV